MSYTEIFRFGTNGDAIIHAWVSNSWQGAVAIWKIMEERYLPPYIPPYVRNKIWYTPGMSPIMLKKRLGSLPSRIGPGTGNAMEEIWNLVDNPRIPLHERIVLFTTLDDILVKKENIPQVIDAFRKFEGETTLNIQANVLEHLMARNDFIAVGWNQNSVNTNSWECRGGYDKQTNKELPYNCLSMQQHQWLFEELCQD